MAGRLAIDAMETLIGQEQRVLDHGFIRLVDYMGGDSAIAQAARVSYGKGTKTLREDRNLVRYLMRNGHSSPFEMCEIKLHIKMPLFIARQWVRHRTASINECSGRYSIMEDDFYTPAREQICAQSSTNKQGREGDSLSEAEVQEALLIIRQNNETAYKYYQKLLNRDDAGEPLRGDYNGITRELARITLPLNIYTQWYWKTDLRNLLHFLKLRLHSHAQYEIRLYAQVIANMVQEWVPQTWEAFKDYVLEAVTLSQKDYEKSGKDFIFRDTEQDNID